MWNKYAHLLLHYCLSLKEGERILVSTSFLAEPLAKELYREACRIGAQMEFSFSFEEMGTVFMQHAKDSLLDKVSPFYALAIENFDAYLVVRAPYNTREEMAYDADKQKRKMAAGASLNKIYFDRTASGSLKRCLCQFPTQGAANDAGMSLDAYTDFIACACKLNEEDPIAAWQKLGADQQHIVDYLNGCHQMVYINEKTNISFSVKDRIWINSDGKANMPSGEVYTGAIEDSINGHIYFDVPSIYQGQEVEGIYLEVVAGYITHWRAEKGQAVLDKIMEIDGSRRFGEVAIGTNYSIKQPTKNILFDEKIGGTIHMAVGQSYKQTGGKNESTVHWDMIASMGQGRILADGKCIYENGFFTI